jgi:hypothetical protein
LSDINVPKCTTSKKAGDIGLRTASVNPPARRGQSLVARRASQSSRHDCSPDTPNENSDMRANSTSPPPAAALRVARRAV